MRASHEGSPSANTLLGHSYGTTLVGHAASSTHLPVDNIVLVASPGVGVDHAAQLNIPPDHVYSTTAEHDLINITNFPRGITGSGDWLDPSTPRPRPHRPRIRRKDIQLQPRNRRPVAQIRPQQRGTQPILGPRQPSPDLNGSDHRREAAEPT
ncbi:alpha/beta hydrolase [Amycolatopsis orientalis]|uniref:alpha/beta hydrolase n=1 Tax=Amycolatopsis orientalis TaxID=31958 RepID=UPI001F1E61FF|nr:alpha/beta hydrolase [Amycolatopsis orientalis]